MKKAKKQAQKIQEARRTSLISSNTRLKRMNKKNQLSHRDTSDSGIILKVLLLHFNEHSILIMYFQRTIRPKEGKKASSNQPHGAPHIIDQFKHSTEANE